MSINHFLAGVALASLLFLPADGLAQPSTKLVDPEGHGFRLCTNAVRSSVAGCNTWGLNQDDVVAHFPINQLEVCRAECDECCATLPQFGDGAAFAVSMQNLCSCFIEHPILSLDGIGCLWRIGTNNPDFISVLFGLGLLDGNGFEAPDLPYPTGGVTVVNSGDMTGIFGPSVVPPGAIGPPPQPSWSLNSIGISGLIGACAEFSDDYAAALVGYCATDCKNSFPTRTEIEMPDPEDIDEGGGGPDGPDDGPGGPEPDCAQYEGQICVTSYGSVGTITADCGCEYDFLNPPGGEGPIVSTEDGCGGLPWDVPEDQCLDWIESQCWLCYNDPDPPPYCDDCWF